MRGAAAIKATKKGKGEAHKDPDGGFHAPKDGPDGHLFRDINDIKKKKVDPDEAESAKYSDSPFGKLAKNKKFEGLTIGVILANALVIGYDIDYSARFDKPENLYDAPMQFIIFEVGFCVFFTFEILIRLFAYKKTLHCVKDPWFVFDSILVTFMVMETFILPFMGNGSPLGQLSILRLLRLLRITRMAKLMRAFPELMMIIKGMVSATKAVVWTAILLVIITYTWAILFTNEYHQGTIEDDEVEEGSVEEFFGSMGKSMLSLLVMGTILDDVTACTDVIRSTDNHKAMLLAFIAYILINSFTMMNMLVGILVEVVSKTAEREKMSMLEDQVRENITQIFDKMDKDGNNEITRKEFLEMRGHKSVMKALLDLGIEEKQFEQYAELMFEVREGNAKEKEGDVAKAVDVDEFSISFDMLLNMILRLRPGNPVQTLDFQAFKGLVEGTLTSVKDRVMHVETMCSNVYNTISGDEALLRLLAEDLLDDYPGDQIVQEAWGSDRPALPADTSEEPQAEIQRINVHMLSQLEETGSGDIIGELQRRLHMTNLEETGVPLSLMDEELQQRICSAEGFQSMGGQQADLAWSHQAIASS